MRNLPYRYLHQDTFKDPLQIKTERCLLRKKLDLHWHEYYQLNFIISGRGTSAINGVTRKLEGGSAFLISPADFHEIAPEEGTSLEIYKLAFPHLKIKEELLELIFRGEKKIERYAIFSNNLEFDTFAKRLENLSAEIKAKRPAHEIFVQSELNNILIQWHRARFISPKDVLTSQAEDSVPTHPGIQRALSYIQLHFREALTLQQIASIAHLSVSYFSELFRTSVGMTFQKYLQLQRLQFAMSTLRSSSSSITQVSYAAGFNTLTHFERTFKQRFGMTPSEVKQTKQIRQAS